MARFGVPYYSNGTGGVATQPRQQPPAERKWWQNPDLWRIVAASFNSNINKRGPSGSETAAMILEQRQRARQWEAEQKERAEDEAWQDEQRARQRKTWEESDRAAAEEAAARSPERMRERADRRMAELESQPPAVREHMRLFLGVGDDEWAEILDRRLRQREPQGSKPKEARLRTINGDLYRETAGGDWERVIDAPEREPRVPQRSDAGSRASATAEWRRALDVWEDGGAEGPEPRLSTFLRRYGIDAPDDPPPASTGGPVRATRTPIPGRDPGSGSDRLPLPSAPPPEVPSATTRASAAEDTVPPDVATKARERGFDVAGARRAGYTWAEIRSFLGV